MSNDAPLAVTTPAEWRAWLAEHGGTAGEAWVVIPHARSGRPGLTQRQALEEALCFGWIDGLSRGHDATARKQRFSPRSPRSAWSTINRELVAQLIADGRMTPAGQAAIDAAQANGMWLLLADAQAGIVPDDLRAALEADRAAAAGWEAMSRSARRAELEALARAKKPETRVRRIAAVAAVAAAAAKAAEQDRNPEITS
ncbi:YdeI/OmpD-associated family protein [Pseudonocardia kujensis]|uniref:YdeI/OmpD-associated family protein n=1 Tax=Pseudonocardia kujensis TaxID=1128675 RepID=UPI001E4A34DB|nr:YdeI/OmpD-associated family protein [Pseudonocardia kujensis]MCE0763145.1 YdeI/OmpD-associated family protein [Pseudonocardia kujensis]